MKQHKFYDDMSGRTFKSNQTIIESAVNQLNTAIATKGGATLNDFYDMLGLDAISLGDNIGWDNSEPVEVRYMAMLGKQGEPMVLFSLRTEPTWARAWGND